MQKIRYYSDNSVNVFKMERSLRFVLNTLAEFLSAVCVDILPEDTSLSLGLIFYVEVISSQAFVMLSNIIVRP